MTSPDTSLETLLAAIYEAPLEQPRWRQCLVALRSAFAADGAVLTLRDPATALRQALRPERSMVLMEGFPEVEATLESNIYGGGLYAADPFVNLPQNKAVTLAEHTDMESLESGEFYRLCMAPFGIHHILGVDLYGGSEAIDGSLRLTRRRESPAFGADDGDFLDRLIPHLLRALRIHSHIDHAQAERTFFAEAVSRFALATLLLDERRRLVDSNPPGERLLAEDDGIRLQRGEVRLARPEDTQALRQLVEEAAAARERGDTVFTQAMPVQRPSGGTPYSLVVRPMPAGELSDRERDPVVALLISDPDSALETPDNTLGQLFGLTPAESRLALQLANGQSLDEASVTLHISRNTARAHLRSIFAKTGVSQQAQLVRLVHKSVAGLG